MANRDARSSKQNQHNINESQRDTVKRRYVNIDYPAIELQRMAAKNSIRNGLMKQRRDML